MTRLTIDQARLELDAAVEGVVQSKEPVALIRDGQTVAYLIDAESMRCLRAVDEPAKDPRSEPKPKRPRWLEYALELSERIPDEALANVPTDSSLNLEHYLYGAPKREE
ncbi:MAG: hypothetical protein NTW86_02725 [Candidatus Sumerlaeota bacterium]|nr:hypothetical protein [Candidatus Sumerlaeota bacterium]